MPSVGNPKYGIFGNCMFGMKAQNLGGQRT